jgi:hypothetical protein
VPVAGECVTAVPVGADFARFPSPEIAISTASGRCTLTAMQPGSYKLQFSGHILAICTSAHLRPTRPT